MTSSTLSWLELGRASYRTEYELQLSHLLGDSNGPGGDFGELIALIGLLAGIGILAGAFTGAYFFGKSRGLRETLEARDPELLDRIGRVEQIVEATSIEIERISEGQAFTAKLLAERKTVEQ